MADGEEGQSQSLTGSEDYFLFVLRPNKEAFFGKPSAFASALNLATALYHFHEWLFAEFETTLTAKFNVPLKAAGDFWHKVVQPTNSKFGYIRDVTNASKHVNIGTPKSPPPSTGMSHISNTHIIVSGYGQGGYGHGGFGGAPSMVFEDSG